MNILRTLWSICPLIFTTLYGSDNFHYEHETKSSPIFIAFTRHLPTQENASAISHGTSGGTIDCSGSFDYIQKLWQFSRYWNLSAVYSGSSFRHYATAAFAYQQNPNIEVLNNFDELDLGGLAGKTESEIYRSIEFRSLLRDPDYRIPYEDGERYGESQNDTWNRAFIGLVYVIRKALQDDNGGIIDIATSRITMNVIMRRILDNPNFLCPNIPNCGTYFFHYIPSGCEFNSPPNLGKFELLNDKPVVLEKDINIPLLKTCQINPIDTIAASYDKVPVRCVTPQTITSHPVFTNASKRIIAQSPTIEGQESSPPQITFQLKCSNSVPPHKKGCYEPHYG